VRKIAGWDMVIGGEPMQRRIALLSALKLRQLGGRVQYRLYIVQLRGMEWLLGDVTFTKIYFAPYS
jgi:hypothetical protein